MGSVEMEDGGEGIARERQLHSGCSSRAPKRNSITGFCLSSVCLSVRLPFSFVLTKETSESINFGSWPPFGRLLIPMKNEYIFSNEWFCLN
jgi:hypothetical protein